jgi:hypothetical protein
MANRMVWLSTVVEAADAIAPAGHTTSVGHALRAESNGYSRAAKFTDGRL